MNFVNSSDEKKSLINKIFKSMSYGEVSDSDNLAKDWFKKKQNNLGSFVNGTWITDSSLKAAEIINPCSGQKIVGIREADSKVVEDTLHSASSSYDLWSSLSGHKRAEHLYKIARNIQKHQQLLIILEVLCTGKTAAKVKSQDVPNLVQSFYHFAGWAELWEAEMHNWDPLGIVYVVENSCNNPLMSLSWHLAAALASGNVVILESNASNCLSALFIAEMCQISGLPPGVLNVLPTTTFLYDTFDWHSFNLGKIFFAASSSYVQQFRKFAAQYEIPIDVQNASRPVSIVFGEADLHSAVCGTIASFCFNDPRVESAGCQLLVQDSIKEIFVDELKDKFKKLQFGNSMSKTEYPAFAMESDPLIPAACIEREKEKGAKVISLEVAVGSSAPCLISDIPHSSELAQKKFCGPVLMVLPFRTAKEAISIFNHNKEGSDVSVWCEKLSQALDVAHRLKSGTVWINCQNEVDAAAGYGGVYKSGSMREGGKMSLYKYAKPSWKKSLVHERSLFSKLNLLDYGTQPHPVDASEGNVTGEGTFMNQTFKLYYGGAQKRPDGNTSLPVYNHEQILIGHVPDGGRKDIRNAVEAALTALPKWQSKTAFNRSQILYYVAENLSIRRKEFISDLQEVTLQDEVACTAEVDKSIQRLYYWAAYCDKFGGIIQETQMYGKVLETNEPLGIVGIICPDVCPLLSFVSLVLPAVARGNTVIVVPSEKYPISALKLCQVFETSDVPGGVINVITGWADTLTHHLALHMEVDAIWYHRKDRHGHAFVHEAATTNQKRVWVDCGRNWSDECQSQGLEFLINATYTKTVHIPMGDIFAN